MRIISTPSGTEPSLPKPPSDWRMIGLRTGTIVEHNGVTWELCKDGDEYGSWRYWNRVSR